ncbi:hypothetical protein EVB81_133 [Rhizobium phage RHph_I46]|uniref:Uncharacterized protein n=1 Tax=Rhizobium phage RHph_I1_9 TaxID=2509729 RepID=A0A7S5UY61_9CAUD|nr:hypothetical protein PP936_gp132 [Rhizobium phage RHph_I1_9]QIG69702.1 hypothetical protein EVB81_133 [Rhizobium phage RHph_I46]QIG70983.1 hypothetical protein EVB92_133 [Rhizobium phage RHph_I9]QIG73569.1 hypothetical protein EVC04_132 [Rhizobium phage RHph_I1_9]QIG76322.1 hypothetical protein EVC25_133 [Rhizobium phage RHph_I34]
MYADIPTTYTAADFIRVYAYEPIIQKDFKDWYESRNLYSPADLVITLTQKSVAYTIKVLSTFISKRETVDLIEVTSTVLADTAARFLVSSNGNTREFSGANSSQIVSIKEIRDVEGGVVTYKSGTGDFLYFNLGEL